LPQIGPAASADAVAKAATRAEDLGYDSVWVTERLLFPLSPRTPYGGTPDGSLPDVYQTVLDPIGTLNFVAGQTSRVKLGTSVLVMPYYNPVMLARQLATLDVVSNGRLRVGLGQGWSADEHEATGASLKGRGARADEFIAVLKAIWTTDPVAFEGRYFHIAKSIIQPKPVQKPHPPIYLAAFTPSALKRVSKMADGWQPVGVPVPAMTEMWTTIQKMAKGAGRDPGKLELILRGNLDITGEALGDDRWAFSGTLEQIKADIAAAREAGVDELILDPTFLGQATALDGHLKAMEQVREAAG
jgi:probable F420-dependent oxidoreductase